MKGLGEARRIDDAFQILETVELGVAAGNPKLTPQLVHGLLNALLEAGQCYFFFYIVCCYYCFYICIS